MTVYCKGRGFQNELSLRLLAPHRAETLQVRHKVEEALLEEGCGSPELLYCRPRAKVYSPLRLEDLFLVASSESHHGRLLERRFRGPS